jgi:hypothetical protein
MLGCLWATICFCVKGCQDSRVSRSIKQHIVPPDRETVIFSDGSLQITTISGDVLVLGDVYPHEGGQIILDDYSGESQRRLTDFIVHRA